MNKTKPKTQFALPVINDKALKAMRRSGFRPRVRDPDETPPPINDLWSRGNYHPGDGEQANPSVCRPGSQDALKLKSFGFPT